MSYDGPNPLVVPAGGTGVSSTTAYAVLCGGTTSTAALQSIAGVGTSGQILTSNGPGLLPTFQAVSASGAITSITGNSGGAEVPSSGNFNILGTGSITVAGSANTETIQLTGLTNHNVLVGAGTATITSVAPSATSGVPLISQGASSDPTFGTAVVAGGGTGDTSFTAYAPVCGGTTTTGALQSASTGIGTSGFVLTSNGASSLPTFQAPAATGITTINGDTGSATGSTITFNANSNCGEAVLFTGSGSTVTLSVTDSHVNTFIGKNSGKSGVSGSENTSLGNQTLNSISSGSKNTAVGNVALFTVSTASNNTGIGDSALELCTGGSNTALGNSAAVNLTSGSNNICIGDSAGGSYASSESSNIAIGNTGTVSESNVIRIGTQGSGSGQQNACYIAGIEGVSVSNKNYVTINTSTGQLGSEASTSLFSVNIQVFTSTGTYTPTSGMVYCIIECLGGGGAGGGGAGGAGGQYTIGSGGGAGEYARGFFSAATIGASKSVTIGAGGTGNSGAAGGNGGNTSVGSTNISANGGIGGTVAASAVANFTQGALGGTGGTGGSFRTPGAASNFAWGNVVGGVDGSSNGANSQYGAGGLQNASANGNAGLGYGSGGGGTGDQGNSTARTGGAGAPGIVIVTEYVIS